MSRIGEQVTIASPATKQGIGLHTGERTAVTLLPAEPDAGVVFVSAGVELPATVDWVVSCERATSLGREGTTVAGVEHLLAALHAVGVDNVRAEVEGPELPACDGSAREWVALLEEAGLRPQGAARAPGQLGRVVWHAAGPSWVVAAPAAELSVAVAVDYGDPVVGCQTVWAQVTPEGFARELAPARTFAFAHELEALRAAGLAWGGSEENAFAIGPEGYVGELRFPDEVVRHKALDLVGDLALCGRRLEACVFAVRPSHAANVALAGLLREALGAAAHTS